VGLLSPSNQASNQDVEALINCVYANPAMDLDYILPFAGIPENGCEMPSTIDLSLLAV
jgi:fatty acid synthase subunit alpha, fungi type